ncbi:hypothetical protein [Hymenobacter wooponensis]|uniref:Uncharacterized protein n=1 Tax=Hymenobacter wooponensis TaxID=1525360 RepID=A0A4Z0MT63_9BACT|nr:hypothetical protein [Hymenobacter wooponensis]TGD82881.1 hypothetical protein EU557_03615 [Hymenobacter wooponensis]
MTTRVHHRFIWRVLGFWLFYSLVAVWAAQAQTSRALQAQNAACTTQWLTANLWIREATGRNDGPAVTRIILENGGVRGNEWCGFTQAEAQKRCGLPRPKGAGGSYNWFLDSKRNVLKGKVGSFDSVQVGHKIGIYSASRGRIAHITACVELARAVRKGRPARGAWCIGGNEGRGTNAGMHRTFYAATDIYAAANWNY